MKVSFVLTVTLSVLSFVISLAGNVSADERNVVADRGKGRIEVPLKEVLAVDVTPIQPFQPKYDIESPTRRLVASSTGAADNPKVEPGKVQWHSDFAAACAAAKTSGKPVLLFQMMGNLDDRFC